jgi:REP element-mobilizing transposase RayT
MRKTEFVDGEYYHIYNRGVDKRDIFIDDKDYKRFLLSMNLLNNEKAVGSIRDRLKLLKERERIVANRASNPVGTGVESLFAVKPLVTIVAYCLNPTHYHFILKQNTENGITEFMKKIGSGYTSYFNKKHKRSGSLFQGRFKSVHIDSNEYLLYLTTYVNKNNYIHGYDNENWIYSSELDYIGKRNGNLCDREIILGQFNNDCKKYEEFMKENVLYLKNKKDLERLILE